MFGRFIMGFAQNKQKGKYNMISFFLIIGIIGGIETGAPLSNIIYAFIILAIDMALIMITNRKRDIKR